MPGRMCLVTNACEMAGYLPVEAILSDNIPTKMAQKPPPL